MPPLLSPPPPPHHLPLPSTQVKLGVLKFFKVDDAGKVERLRQACPTCGPATFMAKHFDRVYCGKCHATYMVEAAAGGGGGKKGKK